MKGGHSREELEKKARHGMEIGILVSFVPGEKCFTFGKTVLQP